jgi:hypothetical protein
MYLISTKEALKYVQQLEDCTLPREKWSHGAHLIVGLYMVLNYKEKALPEMRERIWRYNEIKGNGNNNTGYHETLTVFWLWAVWQFALKNNITTFDEVSVDLLIFDETLGKRKLVEDYYHVAVLMSPYARRHFEYPEFKEMEGVDYFLSRNQK